MDGKEWDRVGKPVARDTQINCKLQDKLAWLFLSFLRPSSLPHIHRLLYSTTTTTTLSLAPKNNSQFILFYAFFLAVLWAAIARQHHLISGLLPSFFSSNHRVHLDEMQWQWRQTISPLTPLATGSPRFAEPLKCKLQNAISIMRFANMRPSLRLFVCVYVGTPLLRAAAFQLLHMVTLF